MLVYKNSINSIDKLTAPQNLSVYIHFPWCLQKCHYCDFYSIGINQENSKNKLQGITKEESQQYTTLIKKELQERLRDGSAFHNLSQIVSIYLGGGSPSLLSANDIQYILDALRKEYTLTPDCEITLEANPENINSDYLQSISQAGITRINVGIQTFQGDVLSSMNRFYDPDSYSMVLQKLEASPLSKNFGLDLIYGFPGQTQKDFYNDLDYILKVHPAHLSLYSLTVEPNTVYGQVVHQQRRTNKKIENSNDLPEIEGIAIRVKSIKSSTTSITNSHRVIFRISTFDSDRIG